MSGPVGGGEKDVYDEINITPMLDLAYVLLIIFIILTTATVQGIKVNLPKASAQPSLAENKTKAVTISADGTIYLDTFPVTLTELETHLRQLKAADPNLPRHHQGRFEHPVPASRRRARPARASGNHEARACHLEDRQVVRHDQE